MLIAVPNGPFLYDRDAVRDRFPVGDDPLNELVHAVFAQVLVARGQSDDRVGRGLHGLHQFGVDDKLLAVQFRYLDHALCLSLILCPDRAAAPRFGTAALPDQIIYRTRFTSSCSMESLVVITRAFA